MENKNLAETLVQEMRKPMIIPGNDEYIALPAGWALHDIEPTQSIPRRKKAHVSLEDEIGYVSYLKRHGSMADCTIWCDADYLKGNINFTAIINDHKETEDGQQWRDHLATFRPGFSVEFIRWINANQKKMTQGEFAEFIERNLGDIASAEGYPTGTAMLQMATNLEISQDHKFKSALRLQSGGVRMEYIDDANAETVKSMEVFSKFALGLPIFRNGTAYQIEARLKYQLREGKLAFWYELIREDKSIEDAAHTITERIQAATGFPLFHGNPFAK